MTHYDYAADVGRSAGAAVSLADAQLKRDSLRFRAAAVVLLLSIALTIAWIVPWIPFGMRQEDYDARTAAGIALVALLGLGVTAFAVRWTPMLQQEPLSEFIKALMGQSMLVRGRARFLRRLETQCERARNERGSGFSLLVLDLPGVDRERPEDEARFSGWLASFQGVVRADDVVGDSGSGEIWLLLQASGPEGCLGVADRIRTNAPGATTGTRQLPDFGIGYSTFGLDGRDPETLFRVARLAAQRSEIAMEAA